jgi:hypothetical protein
MIKNYLIGFTFLVLFFTLFLYFCAKYILVFKDYSLNNHGRLVHSTIMMPQRLNLFIFLKF